MAMIYGFSGSDLEPVSSNSFDIVDLMIIIGMCILIPYNDWANWIARYMQRSLVALSYSRKRHLC
jgi:hypothetical protein